jgi:hypothetical protein
MFQAIGFNRVTSKLTNLNRNGGIAGDRRLGKHVSDMTRLLSRQKYPPLMTNPPQRYKRTGLFGRSWSDRKLGFGRYLLTNTAPYSKWVTHRKHQAWMHKNPHRAQRNSRPWFIATNVTKPADDQLAKVIGFRIVDEYK